MMNRVGLKKLTALVIGLSALCASACAQEPSGAGPTADDLFDAYLEEDRALIAQWEERAERASVVEELAHRTERDQRIRRLFLTLLETPGASPDDAQFTWLRLAARMQRLDRNNAAWLKAQLQEIDWFTISEYGEDADNNAFLIVQHATHDLDFMREMLARFTRLLEAGEIAPDNFALLTDRIAVLEERPQPYGSQFACVEGEQRLQTPLSDPEPIVDARRSEVGLPSLETYRALLPDCGSLPG